MNTLIEGWIGQAILGTVALCEKGIWGRNIGIEGALIRLTDNCWEAPLTSLICVSAVQPRLSLWGVIKSIRNSWERSRVSVYDIYKDTESFANIVF